MRRDGCQVREAIEGGELVRKIRSVNVERWLTWINMTKGELYTAVDRCSDSKNIHFQAPVTLVECVV